MKAFFAGLFIAAVLIGGTAATLDSFWQSMVDRTATKSVHVRL